MPTTSVVGTGAGMLPRGGADAARQVAIWAAFALAYEAARAVAGDAAAASHNARSVIELEQRLGGLVELDLQRPLVRAGSILLQLADWTYWLAQFVVVLLVVVWIYLAHQDAYRRVRNAIMAANTIGLVGYVLFPLAPPRLVPGYGFVDTLALSGPFDHHAGIVDLFANPYAAMPSLHTADALIVCVALAAAVRRRLLRVAVLSWPVWVAFCVVATGNHFWIDVAAGVLVALVAWACTGAPAGRAWRRLLARLVPRAVDP